MALPKPSTAREAISMKIELDMLQRSDDTTIIDRPATKIFFLPKISAIRPKGTTKMAAESRNPVTIHPSSAWSGTAKSALMVGRAMFTEEPKKGVIKDAMQVINSTIFLSSIGLGLDKHMFL